MVCCARRSVARGVAVRDGFVTAVPRGRFMASALVERPLRLRQRVAELLPQLLVCSEKSLGSLK